MYSQEFKTGNTVELWRRSTAFQLVPPSFLSLLFNPSQQQLSRDVNAHKDLPRILLRKIPADLPTGECHEDFSQLRFSSFQIILVCVSLTQHKHTDKNQCKNMYSAVLHRTVPVKSFYIKLLQMEKFGKKWHFFCRRLVLQ